MDLLGVQETGPGEYQASFWVQAWNGGISSVRVVQGGSVIENESVLNSGSYPSPFPQGLTGPFSITYLGTGQDAKATFTNVWGAETTIDLGIPLPSPPLTNLVPETTVAAFGIAGLAWLIVGGILKTRRVDAGT